MPKFTEMGSAIVYVLVTVSEGIGLVCRLLSGDHCSPVGDIDLESEVLRGGVRLNDAMVFCVTYDSICCFLCVVSKSMSIYLLYHVKVPVELFPCIFC